MDRAVAHLYLRTAFPWPCGEDYIKEAEHMEGLSYWSEFANVQELHADAVLYFQGANPQRD